MNALQIFPTIVLFYSIIDGHSNYSLFFAVEDNAILPYLTQQNRLFFTRLNYGVFYT